MTVSRRRLLAAAAGAFTALSGCATSGPAGDDVTGDSTNGTPTDTPHTGPPGPGIPVSGRWPQEGFDAGHGGVGPRTGVPGEGATYWQHRRIRSGSPVLADGRLYHYAELGEDPGGTATPTPSPSTPEAIGYTVDGNPHLVARDAATGALEWWAPLANPSAGWPAVAGDAVVFGANGEVVAVAPATGERRWTDAFDTVTHGTSSFARPVGSPTVVGDAVIVPLPGVVDDGEYVVVPRVRAYAADGTERWTVRAPKRGLGVAAGGGPATDHSVAVVLAYDYDRSGTVRARSAADGTVRWETTVPGGFFEGPVVADGAAYVAGNGGLSALALDDGRERWRADFGNTPALAAGGGAVYAAAGDALLKLDAADGRERWRRQAGSAEFVAPPAVGDGVVYAGTMGGEWASMLALDAATGDRRWSVRLPSTTVEGDMVMAGVRARPTLGDGAVYVDAVDGLYGFGPES